MSSGYQFQSDFALTYIAKGRQEGKLEGMREGMLAGMREGKREGKREGMVQSVLTVLEARSRAIPAEVRERIVASTDLGELDRWLRRAAVVSDARELFEATST